MPVYVCSVRVFICGSFILNVMNFTKSARSVAFTDIFPLLRSINWAVIRLLSFDSVDVAIYSAVESQEAVSAHL